MAKQKFFVLSRESVLSSEGSTLKFGDDNTIVIPRVVFNSLRDFTGVPERERIAQQFLNYCLTFDAKLLSTTGCIQENGSILRISSHTSDEFTKEIRNEKDLTNYDRSILQLCLELSKTGENVTLISQNPVFRFTASAFGIKSEPLKHNLFPPIEEQYTGILEIDVDTSVISAIKSCGESGYDITNIYNSEDFEWIENMFVVLKSPAGNVLKQYHDGKLFPTLKLNKMGKIKAVNIEQEMLFSALLAPPEDIPLVVAKGGAGTGKTFCSLIVGLNQLVNYSGGSEVYRQILVASPTIGMDDDIGYLPGSVEDKMGPYIGGILDNLKAYFKLSNPSLNNSELESNSDFLFENRLIEVQAIRFLRGRSIQDTLFIIDEAQNIPVDIILDILTRAGKGSKIVLMGDPSQINRKELNSSYNGLTFASEVMKGSKVCAQVTLSSTKSIRSTLAQEAINRIKR